ncbi:MAG: DHA1 family tetracycline resistance protein-like MFS transporter [Cellvibrionaceae bacterium]|jgi:DHA1 family tetracycline resistance protein-like MFS transporter
MNKKTLPIILLNIVNGIGGTLLIPVLPFIIRDLGYDASIFGVLLAVYPTFQFFGAPVLGSLSDHYGRKPILLVSQAGTLLSWVIFGIAYFATGAVWPLLIIAFSRVIDGITGGNQSVANAYLADVTTDEERTKVFGVLGASMAVALMIGPALGSFASAGSIGYLGAAIFATALSTITLIIMMFMLTESLAPENRSETLDLNPFHQLNMLSKIRHLTHVKSLTRLFATRGLFNLVFGGYTTILVLWYADRLGLDQTQVGLMLLSIGVFLIFNELVLLPQFEKRFGDLGTLIAGFAITPIGLLLIRFPESVWVYLPMAFILNLGAALTFPTLQSVITKVADERQEGEVQGVDTSIGALFSAIAPILAGFLYSRIGGNTLYVLAALGALGLIFLWESRQVIDDELPHPEIHPEAKVRETWTA